MKFLYLPIYILLISFSSSVFAYSVRCNKQQTSCQIKTKRLTIGDYVGIFGDDGYLQAIGRVSKLNGIKRILKIQKRYGVITADSKARIIEDNEAQSPKKYFRIGRVENKHTVAAAGGIAQLGLGDGFTGYNIEGQYAYSFTPSLFLLAKLNYIGGSGIATDNLGEIGETSVDFSSIGLTGGLAYQFLPNAPVTVRFGLDIGFSNVSVATGEGDPYVVLRERVDNGFGLLAKLGFVAIFRTDTKFDPFFEADYVIIQSSQSPVLMLGLRVGI